MFDCTIIIPTHNRHQYLYRSIEYFSTFNCKIIYIDSTNKAFGGEFGDNVQYIHLPGSKFHEKALFAIQQVNSKNVAFCADDDFIIESSLKKGVDILDYDGRISSVVGKYLGFYDKFNGNFFEIKKKKSNYKVSSNSKENIKNYLSNYHQILWALYRKDIIKAAYEVISKAQFINDNFIEIVIATICSAKGGVYFINDLWGVREVSASESWGRRHKPLYEVMDTENFHNDRIKFMDEMSKYIAHSDAIFALDSYLFANRKKKSSHEKSIRTQIIYRVKKLLKYIVFRGENIKDLRLEPIRNILNKDFEVFFNDKK